MRTKATLPDSHCSDADENPGGASHRDPTVFDDLWNMPLEDGVPYLLGMAKIKGNVKILLDIDQVVTYQELHGLESVLS
jgi:hypothetical protein